ncbi:MAG: hypothetical protein LKM31_10650 [Sphingobium sp.]|jgi:hypothetical protein|nr:hypothetical protein [Sphingobium sp.]
MSEDQEFRVRPGKGRRNPAHARNLRSFVAQILAVASKSGAGRSHGWASPAGRGQSSFGRGRTAFARSRLFGSNRRVIVKALPVRQRGGRRPMAPLSAHIAYLNREGVTRDGSPTRMFDAETDRADARGFAERCKDDRHHFRIIVSPEDAAELTDLRFTRDLAPDGGRILGTRLDWVAVDHWNTDNPHIHMLVRGVDLRAGISSWRATISATACVRAPRNWHRSELGPKPEHEIVSARLTVT